MSHQHPTKKIFSKKKNKDWQSGSNGRAPAYQA
jgi:hypothetical protein